MAEVVGAELQLEAVGRAYERRRHDSRVVDHDGQAVVARCEPRREVAHAGERRQIDETAFERSGRHALTNRRFGCCSSFGGTDRQRHRSPGGGKGASRLEPEAGGCAGDQRDGAP